jgi:uncharacterized alpha-E superfamily protein
MLLARVAESMYWTGRYVERAEAGARLVKVHTEQYVDLPRSAGLGWAPLLAVTGTVEEYARHHPAPTEEGVVAFLVTDPRNPGSIVSSLTRARENVRTTRAVLPREAWEVLYRLVFDAAETAATAVDRSGRRAWTAAVMAGCQRFVGTVATTMSHDEAYHLMHLGAQIERADLTARVLDVRAAPLLHDVRDRARPYRDVAWSAVLRSLSAQQMYRRSAGGPRDGTDIVRFLIEDSVFPRSLRHCVAQIRRDLGELPGNDAAMEVCAGLLDGVGGAAVVEMAAPAVAAHVRGLQGRLADLHDAVCGLYETGPESWATATMDLTQEATQEAAPDPAPEPVDGQAGSAATPVAPGRSPIRDALATA